MVSTIETVKQFMAATDLHVKEFYSISYSSGYAALQGNFTSRIAQIFRKEDYEITDNGYMFWVIKTDDVETGKEVRIHIILT